MYGNPCLRAARKSRSGERVRPGVGVFRVEFGQRQTTDALIGAIWSNAKRRQGFYVVENDGRPVGPTDQLDAFASLYPRRSTPSFFPLTEPWVSH